MISHISHPTSSTTTGGHYQPSQQMSTAKPRRKPVNYEKLAVITTASSSDTLTSHGSSERLAPACDPPEMGKSGSSASLESVGSHRFAEASPVHTSSSPRLARKAPGTVSSLSTASPRSAPLSGASPRTSVQQALERPPLSAGPQRNVAPGGPREAPRPPLPQRTLSTSVPRTETLSRKPPQAVDTPEPTKQELNELREPCESVPREQDESALKVRRRAQFGLAKTDSNLLEQFKQLTDDAEARKSEQQDLHAAVELLMRRTKALEMQVVALGAEPVTKTDGSLSEARLDEITKGVWKKFDHLSDRADGVTTKTNTVMADILAKTREIRQHLKLSPPEGTTENAIGPTTPSPALLKRRDSETALAVEALAFHEKKNVKAGSKPPCGASTATTLGTPPAVPKSPKPIIASRKKNEQTVSSPSPTPTPVHPLQTESTSERGQSFHVPPTRVDSRKTGSPPPNNPCTTTTTTTRPALADGSTVGKGSMSGTGVESVPLRVLDTNAALATTAGAAEETGPTAERKAKDPAAFADDLMSIMSDFGF
ncbi:hypothetical protein HKX48_006822 [Thoreauomyces humboldtii]|nr:hypothetical protein HKX48_006822 [Thoreauomyces humboldtii]